MLSYSSLQEECAFEAVLVIPMCHSSHHRVTLAHVVWAPFGHLAKPEDALQEHTCCAAAAKECSICSTLLELA